MPGLGIVDFHDAVVSRAKLDELIPDHRTVGENLDLTGLLRQKDIRDVAGLRSDLPREPLVLLAAVLPELANEFADRTRLLERLLRADDRLVIVSPDSFVRRIFEM